MSFTFVDVLLVAVVGLAVWQGWRRGLLLGLLDLLSWAWSILLALRFYPSVARWIGPRVDLWEEAWDMPVAFLLTMACAGLFIQIVGHAILRRLPEGTHESKVNRFFGMLPGFASGLISAAVLAALMLAAPLPEVLRDPARESVLANSLASYTEVAEDVLGPVFNPAIQQTLNRLTIHPDSNERVELGYKVLETRPRPDLEAQMLALVNREREARSEEHTSELQSR